MSGPAEDRTAALLTALEPLPTAAGGVAVVLATSGPPPALALLSTGDVRVRGSRVRAALVAGSSAGDRLGGAFSLLVPVAGGALRAEVVDATATVGERLLLLEGRLAQVRATAEPPWSLTMEFRPAGGAGVDRFVEYWRGVRAWLDDPGRQQPPLP